MTSPKQAEAQLARLFMQYCPLLDALRDSDAKVETEQRLGEQIWALAGIAWGPKAEARLKYLKPEPTEYVEIADLLLEKRYKSEAHRTALIGCCVRSQRLSTMLDNMKAEREPDLMKRVAKRHAELVAERGGDSPKLRREVAEEMGCPLDTVRKAIKKYGTVPL